MGYEYASEAALLLDDRYPGWFNQIDIDRLEQSSSSDCVLGQLYNDYDIGLSALGLDLGGAAFNGGVVNEKWYIEIQKRREGNATGGVRMIPGRKYRVTTILEYHGDGIRHEFKPHAGYGGMIFLDKGKTQVSELPYEVREGDVYKRGKRVFKINAGAAFESGVFGTQDPDLLNFTPDELIYREDSE